MNELIKLNETTINNLPVKTVNARELHTFLESKQDFSTWIKNRVSQYDFIENQDFVRLHKKMEANNATQIDYHLTLDMAKELAMVERNQRGKEARQYFIECERIAKQQIKPMSLSELALYSAQKLVELERAQTELEQRQQITEHRLDKIETATDHFTVIGWWRYAKQSGSLPLAEAARLGKIATQYCTDHGIELGTVPDQRFGRVHTYPKWVLDEVIDDCMQTTH